MATKMADRRDVTDSRHHPMQKVARISRAQIIHIRTFPFKKYRFPEATAHIHRQMSSFQTASVQLPPLSARNRFLI